jgi:hypothetical protein
VLARLDDELAPARSQTDRAGSYLRVMDVPDGAGDVVPRVREIVRELGHEVEPPTAGDPVPDDWYDKETIRELSVHEADTITETWLSEFARQAGLNADREQTLKDASRRTLIEIFDRWRAARRAPSPGEAVDELRAGVAAVLTPSEVEALGAWLAAKAASLGEP